MRTAEHVHNPSGPLAVWLRHLLNYEAKNEGGLIKKTSFNNVMS